MSLSHNLYDILGISSLDNSKTLKVLSMHKFKYD